LEHDFWHRRWAKNQIPFHEPQAHPLLLKHLPALALPAGSRLFLPLCGKTLDIGWLLAAGYRVVGAELSELAVQQLFEELEQTPSVSSLDSGLSLYQGPDLDVFVGDIFALDSDRLGSVEAVYDRAALIALPEAMRARYARQIGELSGKAAQLLISIEYDQTRQPGPPFSVAAPELQQLYGEDYRLQLLERLPLEGGLKRLCPADELVWHLQPR